MDGIVDMNKQEIDNLINSIITRISKRCQINGDEEIQIIIDQMKYEKFFPNQSVEIIGSVDYCELIFGCQNFVIHFKDHNLYIELCSGKNYFYDKWGDWSFGLSGHQVVPKEIKTTIYERVED